MAPKKATPTESSRKSTRVVVPAPVKPAPEPKAKKAAPKKKAASKKRVESEEDEDSDEEAPPPKRARVAPVERVTLEKVAKEPKPKVEKVVKAAKLQVGDSLPAELVLQNENDEAITIGTLTADQGLIIFSYPKANSASRPSRVAPSETNPLFVSSSPLSPRPPLSSTASYHSLHPHQPPDAPRKPAATLVYSRAPPSTLFHFRPNRLSHHRTRPLTRLHRR